MTTPLTPPESDLQDFPFMPLHVARLRDSDLASEESPEACWYAVLLWAASWHQLPAGSLPDNEMILTRLIGLGRDVKTFRKHRDGALRGFVKCDDGRLYHPVVAEQVVAAWEGKLQQRWRSELARIKKANQRNGTNLPSPTFEEFIAGKAPAQPDPGPQSVPGDIAKCPEGRAVQEKGTGKETGTGTTRKDADASPVAGGDAATAFAEWNALAARLALPQAKDLTPARRKLINARLADAGLSGWREALAAVEASPHCRGENDRGWRADLDFVATASKFQKLREGSYGPVPSAAATAQPAATFDGPPDLRAAVVREKDEDYARRWLDHYCRWRQADRTLLARSEVVASTLRRDLGGYLRDRKINVEVAPANDTPAVSHGEAA